MKIFQTGAAVCCFAILAATSSNAQAQSAESPWYGSVGAGVLILGDQSVTAGTTTATANFSTGYTIQGSVGYAFANNLRTELELGYGHSSYDKIKVAGTSVSVSGGGLDIFQAHGAGFYDFNRGGISPYVGGGLGLTHVSRGAVSAGTVSAPSDSNSYFSLFGEAGLAFPVSTSAAIVPSARYVWVNSGDTGVENNTGWIFKAALRFSF